MDSYLLAHLARPRLAIERLVDALAPGGVIVLEFDHLLSTVEGSQWDAIGHGHPVYLSLSWIVDELGRAGLVVFDAVPQPVYGGGLRVFATAGGTMAPRAAGIVARERAAALDQAVGLDPLRQALERARHEVVAHLAGARAGGRLVVGYGAPGRAITFLNALDVGPELLSYVVDRAPAKQGRMIPGARIPIRGLDALDQDSPDEVLILTWNLPRRWWARSRRRWARRPGFSLPSRGSLTSAQRILADRWFRPVPACDMARCPIPTTTEID